MRGRREGVVSRNSLYQFQPSLRDFSGGGRAPNVETLGYYQMSLRDKSWCYVHAFERHHAEACGAASRGRRRRGRDRTKLSARRFLSTLGFSVYFFPVSVSRAACNAACAAGFEVALSNWLISVNLCSVCASPTG